MSAFWIGFIVGPFAVSLGALAVHDFVYVPIRNRRRGVGKVWYWDCPECYMRCWSKTWPDFVPNRLAAKTARRQARRDHLRDCPGRHPDDVERPASPVGGEQQ